MKKLECPRHAPIKLIRVNNINSYLTHNQVSTTRHHATHLLGITRGLINRRSYSDSGRALNFRALIDVTGVHNDVLNLAYPTPPSETVGHVPGVPEV